MRNFLAEAAYEHLSLAYAYLAHLRNHRVEYVQAKLILEHPATRLLRQPTAPFILAFLHTTFHECAIAGVPEDSLLMRLERWLEERRNEESFSWERSAKEYLDEWCSESCGWLRKVVVDGGLGTQYELSAATEKALRWLEELRNAERFVGTESRMESIFRELDELLRYANGDVQTRLDHLRAERDRLEHEIAQIEATGEVQTFEPWQVNERYARVLEAARFLISDFRQVEENFRRLAQELVERHVAAEGEKGVLLGRVLDSHDSLRESPQGRSFYGFVRLLLDPDRRERFESQVAEAEKLPALAPELRAEALLPRLLPRLRSEQEKVSASTQRLTGNLRRALESAHLNERRRVRELVGEIQQLALKVKDNPPRREAFFEVEEPPDIYAGMSRPLWDESGSLTITGTLVNGSGELDMDKVLQLQNLPHLSLEALARNVAACLAEQDIVLLTSILERFPPQQGLLEVFGYFILAAREPRRHYIAREFEEVPIPGSECWRLPRVMFCRASFDDEARSGHATLG